MISARKALQQREEELRNIYGRYATKWAEDWPNYVKITFTRDLFNERIKNKFMIFSLFYPVIAFIIAAVISAIIGIASKSILWFPILVVLTILIIAAYNGYFYILGLKVDKMNQIIGHYYSKYGRKKLKELYKKYRAEELPPEPEKYYEMDANWFYEDELGEEDINAFIKGGNCDDEPEPEPEQTPEDEKAAYAFDLRLVGGDGQDDSVDDASATVDSGSDTDIDREAPEKEQESCDSGEPEQTLQEETEGRDRAEEVEAVNVIDVDLPAEATEESEEPDESEESEESEESDDWDNPVPNETEVLSDDDLSSSEDDLELIFSDYANEDDGEELREDQETFVGDLCEELEDYEVEEEPEVEVEEPVSEEEPEPVDSPIEAGGKEEVQPDPIPELKTFEEFFAYFQLDNG